MKLLGCAATLAFTSCSVLAQQPRAPELVRWMDPTERAFTVNVPKDWRISGGTQRNSSIDARNWVEAESPDGKITVRVDDPSILPRQVPHPAYYRLGWYEGRVVLIPGLSDGSRPDPRYHPWTPDY